MNKTKTVPAVKRENLNVCADNVQNEKTLAALRAGIEAINPRSAWKKGVKVYAAGNLEKILLNGARNWREFSYGGCAFIYDSEIAETLCSPEELKRCTRKDGRLRDKPNARQTWLDCQGEALFQACRLIIKILKEKAT